MFAVVLLFSGPIVGGWIERASQNSFSRIQIFSPIIDWIGVLEYFNKKLKGPSRYVLAQHNEILSLNLSYVFRQGLLRGPNKTQAP